MLSRLSNIRSEINKNQVYSINKALTKIKTIVKNVPKAGLLNVKENEKIIDIVERILELNSENQLRLGLKILTPNQMLSRIPVSLAQLNAENNSEKLKKLSYCILCTDQKNLQNNCVKSITGSLIIFKKPRKMNNDFFKDTLTDI